MTPSPSQQHAIDAKLSFMLGAEIFDRLFLGFVCGPVAQYTVRVFVDNEEKAAIIESEYSWHVAVIVESVMKTPVKFVNVLPKNPSDR
jgi:hypothetical protein